MCASGHDELNSSLDDWDLMLFLALCGGQSVSLRIYSPPPIMNHATCIIFLADHFYEMICYCYQRVVRK
jgi:hypothetical protein